MTPDTGHRMRSPETWDAARQAYQAGGGAQDICDRYGLTLSAFRARARREGWRRADMPDPDPALEDELEDGSPRPCFDDMAEMAWRRAARAVGDLGDTRRIRAIGQAARQIHREAVESTRELHQLHQLHRASGDPEPPDPDSHGPPLSRAERRRLEKLRRKR